MIVGESRWYDLFLLFIPSTEGKVIQRKTKNSLWQVEGQRWEKYHPLNLGFDFTGWRRRSDGKENILLQMK